MHGRNVTGLLGINLCIDLLGALPTLRSVYRNPASESALTWRLFFLGNALNLVAIEDWSLRSAIYPVYCILISGLVTVLLSVPARVISRDGGLSLDGGLKVRAMCETRHRFHLNDCADEPLTGITHSSHCQPGKNRRL